MRPGYNEQTDTYAIDDRICNATAKFVYETVSQFHGEIRIADVGERNKKAEIIENALKVNITQLVADDFNFDKLIPENGLNKFNIICCFEVIEHLQNPLFHIKQLVELLEPDGIIFLSTPARPRIFWPDFHYFEIDEKHLNKWIFSQAGLEITRKSKLKIHLPFWNYFKGIRPFLRLFVNYTNIYELRIKQY
ncbi:MAG: class I SAM-dependent methyltransferase [Bacteroidales bacterium]|jgi:SAM-dependent methyltransferase|nr:class I SAM-dependent methyltransferase [Bacteroidales bacterium]